MSSDDCLKCIALLTTAYGLNYATELRERVQLLFSLVREKNWSGTRFISTAKWIIENKSFREWTPSDWFNAPQIKMFGYSKYIQLIHEHGASVNASLTTYRINGVNFWSYDSTLPFDKYQPAKTEPKDNHESVPMPDFIKSQMDELTSKLSLPKQIKTL